MIMFRGSVSFVVKKNNQGLYDFHELEFENIGSAIAVYSDIIHAEMSASSLGGGFECRTICDLRLAIDILESAHARGIEYVTINPTDESGTCVSIEDFKSRLAENM